MIKIGVIGGGLNSAVGKAHLSALSISNSFSISAACFSRNDQMNNETARYFNVPLDQLYPDYKKMIDENKDSLDAILVLTPTDQHTEQVKYSLDNGFSVICEKALSGSIQEAIEIGNSLKYSNSSLYVIYNYLGYPMVKELRQIVNSGKLGNIISVHVEMPQEGYIKTLNGKPITPQEWRLKDGVIPTISLDLGVHLHMMIHYLTGETPLRICATSKSLGNFTGIVDDVNALIEYSNNVLCNMWYSKSASGHRNGLRIRLYGSKGSASWFQMEPEIVQFSDTEGNLQILDRNSPNIDMANNERYNRFKGGHPAGFIEALSNYYIDLAEDFLKSRTSPISSEVFGYDESLEGLKFLQAISLSSAEKRWIEL